MPPEHADMEAEWLAKSLDRLVERAREAYTACVKGDKQNELLYLANIIGSLDELADHYRLVEFTEVDQPIEKKKFTWFK